MTYSGAMATNSVSIDRIYELGFHPSALAGIDPSTAINVITKDNLSPFGIDALVRFIRGIYPNAEINIVRPI